MRLAEIVRESSSTQENDKANIESQFDSAMKKIETGEWDEAYEIFAELASVTLPSDLIHTARMASRILDPVNPPEEKAKRILELMPGPFATMYDEEPPWRKKQGSAKNEVGKG